MKPSPEPFVISGARRTDAVVNIECRRCGSRPGEPCRTPKGRETTVHGQRCDDLIRHPSYKPKGPTVRSFQASEIFGGLAEEQP